MLIDPPAAKSPNPIAPLVRPVSSAAQSTTVQLSTKDSKYQPVSSPTSQTSSAPFTESMLQKVSNPTGQTSSAPFTESVLQKVSSPTSRAPVTEIAPQKMELPKLKPVVPNSGEKNKTSKTSELQTVFTRRGSTGQAYLDSNEDLAEGSIEGEFHYITQMNIWILKELMLRFQNAKQ